MATSDFWQKVSSSVLPPDGMAASRAANAGLSVQGQTRLWVTFDLATILIAGLIAISHELHIGPALAAQRLFAGTLFQDHSSGSLLAILAGFFCTLVVISKRFKLYSPARINSILHERSGLFHCWPYVDGDALPAPCERYSATYRPDHAWHRYADIKSSPLPVQDASL